MKNIGLFIKTYSNEKTSNERINIIEENFESLKNNVDNNIIKILIVDGCFNENHKKLINKYNFLFNSIIYNKYNKGISATTNIGIKTLIYKYNIDIGFSCDDDIIFNKDCIIKYTNEILKTGIDHLCYVPKNLNINYIEYNDNLNIYHCYYGCFYSFTKKIILEKGYLPILPNKYGHEHEVFSKNFTNSDMGIYDLNTDIFINLNNKSIINKSNNDVIYIDNTINYNESKKYINKYIEYNDLTSKIIIIFIYKNNLEQLIENINELSKSIYLNFEIIIICDLNNISFNQFINNLFVTIINDNLYNVIKKYNIINNKICLQYENYIHDLYKLDIFIYIDECKIKDNYNIFAIGEIYNELNEIENNINEKIYHI
jgi:hypothetical protein